MKYYQFKESCSNGTCGSRGATALSALKDYYSKNLYELKKSVNEMPENEKSYYKKLIKMISHEAKAFLNEGADEYIGFYSLILKKK